MHPSEQPATRHIIDRKHQIIVRCPPHITRSTAKSMQWRRDYGTIVALLHAKYGAGTMPHMGQPGEYNDAERHAHDAPHVLPE